MTHTRRTALLAALATVCTAPSALADVPEGFDKCEVVVTKVVKDADGGGMTVATYLPATDFLAGIYDDDVEFSSFVDGETVRGMICVRDDLVPVETDYALLAKGAPLTLSQDFDSAESDLLTIYYGLDGFSYKYKSDYEMSNEFKETLETRLADFSARDHGLLAQSGD